MAKPKSADQKSTPVKLETVVEQMGQYFGDSGRTPMRGRVFAYLLASAPKKCDFKSIREALQASKGAISLALNGLSDQGVVKSYTRPGKRKRYFEVDIEGWLVRSKKEMRSVIKFNELLQSCQVIRSQHKADDDAANVVRTTDNLNVMISFHEGFLRQMEAFVATWEAGRTSP